MEGQYLQFWTSGNMDMNNAAHIVLYFLTRLTPQPYQNSATAQIYDTISTDYCARASPSE
jgi:hypothetical protein